MTACWVRGARFGVLLLFALTTVTAAPRRGELQGVDALVRVYDAILDARFDSAEAELRKACGASTETAPEVGGRTSEAKGRAPSEACDVLTATATWWRILIDPESRALDNRFSAQTERAIASTEAWST